MAAGLNLDVESIRNKQDTYSSLTDMNGIPLFTSVFEERMRTDMEDAESQEQYIESILFTGIEKEDNSARLINSLFTDSDSWLIKRESAERNSDNYMPEIIMLGILLLVFVVILHGKLRNGRTAKR